MLTTRTQGHAKYFSDQLGARLEARNGEHEVVEGGPHRNTAVSNGCAR
jgi:hypothetical protein